VHIHGRDESRRLEQVQFDVEAVENIHQETMACLL
jgi:hypothetical protein